MSNDDDFKLLSNLYDRKYLSEDETLVLAEGFDNAIIGIDSHSLRLIYSCRMAIEILVEEGMSQYDAMEHFEYNVINSYVGEKTPIWCVDNL